MQQNPTSLLIPTQPCHAFTSPQEDCWLCRRAVIAQESTSKHYASDLPLFCFFLHTEIFNLLEFGRSGIRSRGGAGKEAVELYCFPYCGFFFFFFLLFLCCQYSSERWRREQASSEKKKKGKKINIFVLMLINWHADERERKREEHINKPLFKSSLTSENVLAPSKSLQRFWDIEASRHSVII